MIERQASQPPSRHVRQVERAGRGRRQPEREITSLADARAAVAGLPTLPALRDGDAGGVRRRARRMPRSCSSASSRATRRISRASRSSGRPARCSTRRWRRSGSTGARAYVTNAVKHFKFVPRGKRRIHQRPECRRDQGLPLLAQPRARVREAQADRGAGRDGGVESRRAAARRSVRCAARSLN